MYNIFMTGIELKTLETIREIGAVVVQEGIRECHYAYKPNNYGWKKIDKMVVNHLINRGLVEVIDSELIVKARNEIYSKYAEVA